MLNKRINCPRCGMRRVPFILSSFDLPLYLLRVEGGVNWCRDSKTQNWSVGLSLEPEQLCTPCTEILINRITNAID